MYLASEDLSDADSSRLGRQMTSELMLQGMVHEAETRQMLKMLEEKEAQVRREQRRWVELQDLNKRQRDELDETKAAYAAKVKKLEETVKELEVKVRCGICSTRFIEVATKCGHGFCRLCFNTQQARAIEKADPIPRGGIVVKCAFCNAEIKQTTQRMRFPMPFYPCRE